MPKKQTPPRHTTPKTKRWLIALAAITIVVFGGWGVAEMNYQKNVSDMYRSLALVRDEVIKPAGGVVGFDATVTHGGPHFTDSIGCIDTNCPQVEASWVVPVEPRNDLKDILEDKISKIGKEAGHNWSVNVYPSDFDGKVPYPAPAGKKWVTVHAFVYE